MRDIQMVKSKERAQLRVELEPLTLSFVDLGTDGPMKQH